MLSNYNQQIRMAKIAQEIISWLFDKTKIEIKIVDRLHQLDTEQIFLPVFHEALRKCNTIRTPLEGIDGKEYYEAADHKIPSDKFNDSNFHVQSGLGAIIGTTIGSALIQNLYNLNNQAISLRLIQELNAMSMEEEFHDYGRLFELINQNFFHSRSLLAVSMAPQIIEQYAFHIKRISSPKIISFQSSGEKLDKKEICTFLIDGRQYTCEFLKKKEGKFFGSIVQIRDSDGSILKTYYLKAHQWYPALNSKDSKDTYEHTFKYSSTVRSSCELPLNLLHIDLREPFMYKVLEYLGYGPKTYIMMNPYILSGVFIVTEDLNSEPNKFYPIETLKSRIDLQLLLNPMFSHLESARRIITVNLEEVSILSSIFQLSDLHFQNWGYVAEEKSFDELKAGQTPSSCPQICIIDFLIKADLKNTLEERFLRGKIIEGNGIFSRVLELLQDFLDEPFIPQDYRMQFKTLFDTKINQGKQANQQFLVHLHNRSIQNVLEQTKQELLMQLKAYSLIWKVINLEETLSQKNWLNELMIYCSDIENRTTAWNNFITGGYQQWYNNKKDHAPQEEQSEKPPK